MTRRLGRLPWLLVGLLVLSAPSAASAELVDPTVDGNSLSVKIRLPLGVGADLTVSFEQVVGLSLENLGLSARSLSSADLLALQGRLGSTLLSVPAALPMLLTIEPPASGGLSFSGPVAVELYTHNLYYVPGSPLRLFSAPLGGAFTDITDTSSGGSYRVRGRKGDFSEFLILADLRPLNEVIDVKFAQLEDTLAGHAARIEPAVYTELSGILDEAGAVYGSGDVVGTISAIELFAATVEEHGGSGLPNVWRSARDLANVGGELEAAAATLRFSLLLKSNS